MTEESALQSILPQALLDLIGPAIYSTTVDGVVTSFNRGAELMLGYHALELVGQPSVGRWHDDAELARRAEELTRELGRPVDRGFAALVARTMERGETREWTYVRKDGSRVPVLLTVSAIKSAHGALIGFLGVAQDLTERKRLEIGQAGVIKALGDFKAALDVFALVTITDGRGMITYVNDTTCAISKYSREELIGRDSRVVNSAYHPQTFMGELWAAITSGRVWHGEIRNRAKDGSFYWVATTIVPFLDEHGRPERYIALSLDVTERKSEEERIAHLNAELRDQTAQLDAVNRELEAFSHSVSHDLRAPLRGMDGFSQALLEDYADQLDETGKSYLQRIRDASQRMGHLIDDLLDLSRVTRTEMTPGRVDLTALAREVIAELEPQRAGRQVEWVVADALTAYGDLRLLRVALMNLLGNALKFTGKCEQARIELGQENQAGEQAYFVRDNGAGFDMAFAGRLFGAFQRLHSSHEFPGTGIGLATVQRIIHRHGGRVWANARVGQGATLSFTLPLPPEIAP